jgi:surfactin family lipopeptide synthetase A
MSESEARAGVTQLSKAKHALLQRYLRGDLPRTSVGQGPIVARADRTTAPLSLAQEQVWLRAQDLGPDRPPLYNESITIYRKGPLDVAALEWSLTEIIRRHEIWRTTFDALQGQPVQIIHSAPSVKLPVVDLRALPEAEREAEALKVAAEDARRPFDLNRGPLVRFALVRLAHEEHRLFATMHQSIVDGVSVYQVLPSELVALYESFAADKPSLLPELPIQYADYAVWERRWLEGDELSNQMAFWRKQLAGELLVLDWPTARPRPLVQTYRGAIRPFTLPKNLSDALRALSQRRGVTLFMTLLAALMALLHGSTGREDITVGTLAPAGRKRAEVQGLLGYFLNPVALRMDLSGNPRFLDVLEQARGVISGALSNDDVPLERLAYELKPKPDPSRHPFFQWVISLAPPMPELGSGWSQTPMDVESGGARWDLYLELNDRRNGIIGRAQYNPDLFDKRAITRMLEDLLGLLQAASSNPEQRLSELPPFAVAPQRQSAE